MGLCLVVLGACVYLFLVDGFVVVYLVVLNSVVFAFVISSFEVVYGFYYGVSLVLCYCSLVVRFGFGVFVVFGLRLCWAFGLVGCLCSAAFLGTVWLGGVRFW